MASLRIVFLALLTIAFLGCDQGASDPWKGKRPATVPAKGIVTYRGNPLEKAMVVLQPRDAEGVAASALTNSKGEFELQAFPPDAGAVPGSYMVIIVKTDADDPKYKAKPVDNDDPNYGKETNAPVPVSLIPVKYNDPNRSGLTAEISADGQAELKFELKD